MTTIANTFAAKLAVAFVAIAMMISIAAPAKAATDTDLQSQIDALMATIAALQAQLGVSGGGSSASSADVCPYTWTRSLSMGDTGSDVMKLQQFLNADAATQVAVSGAGSAGNETEYYGPATGAAVAKFQEMYRAEILSPLGLVNSTTFFGNSTRAQANALCVAAPVEDTTTDSTTDTTTDSTTDTTTLGSGEGSIDTVIQISADETEVKEGEEAGVFAFEADVTGDVEVNRVDFYADVSGSGASTRADKYFSSASLWVDGDKVATLDTSDWTEDYYAKVSNGTGKEYRLRFSGLNLVFADGDVPQFQVSFDGNNVIDTTDQGATWAVTSLGTSIRIVDGQGFTDNAGLAVEQTFSIAAQLVAKLTVTEDANSPKAIAHEVSNTATTKDIEVAKFEIRERNGVDVTIEDATFTLTATNTVTNESTVVRTASIWDGATKLASKTVTNNGVVLFENMGLAIPADGRVTLTVKLDLADSSAYPDGETVALVWNSINDATDANGNSEGDMTITTGPVAASTQEFREFGVQLAKGTPTVVPSPNATTPGNSYSTFGIEFEVTAFGDDIYVPLTTTRGASSTVGAAYQIEDGNGAVVTSAGTSTGATLTRVSGGTVSGNYVKVTDGQTATFKLAVPYDPATAATFRAQLLSLGYAITAVTPTTSQTATPAEDFESKSDYITS